MDDDKFKREVLGRLDKIANLLSVSCAIANGSLDKARAEAALRQIMSNGKQSEGGESGLYVLQDEMQDDYYAALQKWKAEKGV